MDPFRVIKRPYISEKGHQAQDDQNTLTFLVDNGATKDDIRNALSKIWGVETVAVRTILTQGKRRRYGKTYGMTNPVKKAMVRLKEGQTIEVLKS